MGYTERYPVFLDGNIPPFEARDDHNAEFFREPLCFDPRKEAVMIGYCDPIETGGLLSFHHLPGCVDSIDRTVGMYMEIDLHAGLSFRKGGDESCLL